MSDCYMQDKDGQYIPAIPEPFWKKGFSTLFRWKPSCCGVTFKDRQAYDFHYVTEHMREAKPNDH